MKPLISIMIPTYNRPKLFEITLKSALAQTYDNFEVVVCDNSTDEITAELIATHYALEPRLRYYRNRTAKNKAENFAPFEELARGEYLQWLMDDDVLVPQKLEKMAEILQKNQEVKLVTSRRGIIDGEGKELESSYNSIVGIKGEFGKMPGQSAGQFLLTSMMNFIGEPSAVLFRRKDLIHHYWQAESRGCLTISDVAMWLELLEKGDLVIFREPLSYYRRHAQQEGQSPEVILLSRLEWYALMEEYHTKGIFIGNDADYRKALNILWQEYRQNMDSPLSQQAPEMWKVYSELMQEIGERLV